MRIQTVPHRGDTKPGGPVYRKKERVFFIFRKDILSEKIAVNTDVDAVTYFNGSHLGSRRDATNQHNGHQKNSRYCFHVEKDISKTVI